MYIGGGSELVEKKGRKQNNKTKKVQSGARVPLPAPNLKKKIGVDGVESLLSHSSPSSVRIFFFRVSPKRLLEYETQC